MAQLINQDSYTPLGQVTSLDECPESKPGDEDLTNPSYYRFYHAAPNGEPVSCCKLAWTSIFDAKGWKYKRSSAAHICLSWGQGQKSMELCTYDRRPLPEDVCCRPSYEAGLHLRSVGKFSGQRIRGIRDVARHVTAF